MGSCILWQHQVQPDQGWFSKKPADKCKEHFESAIRKHAFDDAIIKLTVEAQRAPALADAYFWRAATYFMKTIEQVNDQRALNEIIPNCESSLADYSTVIELQPSNAKAYANRSGVYYSLGKEAEAVSDLKRANELGATRGDQIITSPTLRKRILSGGL